jgi:hypothetical protein
VVNHPDPGTRRREVVLVQQKPTSPESDKNTLSLELQTPWGNPIAQCVLTPSQPVEAFARYGKRVQTHPFVELQWMAIEDDFSGRGYRELMTRLAVEYSRQLGRQGRVCLTADNSFGSPSALIHYKSGFRPIGPHAEQKAAHLKALNGLGTRVSVEEMAPFDKLPMALGAEQLKAIRHLPRIQFHLKPETTTRK